MTKPKTGKIETTGKTEVVEEAIIPLVEERVLIEKRATEGRTVSVSTRAVSEDHQINETLSKQNIEVHREPKNEVVEAMPKIREEGDLTIIPVIEERLVVRKELVLTEEIHLRRRTVEEPFERTVTLNRTEISVDEGEKPR